jgi:hypothetical protein
MALLDAPLQVVAEIPDPPFGILALFHLSDQLGRSFGYEPLEVFKQPRPFQGYAELITHGIQIALVLVVE